MVPPHDFRLPWPPAFFQAGGINPWPIKIPCGFDGIKRQARGSILCIGSRFHIEFLCRSGLPRTMPAIGEGHFMSRGLSGQAGAKSAARQYLSRGENPRRDCRTDCGTEMEDLAALEEIARNNAAAIVLGEAGLVLFAVFAFVAVVYGSLDFFHIPGEHHGLSLCAGISAPTPPGRQDGCARLLQGGKAAPGSPGGGDAAGAVAQL
jgi:hypothetical protein